MQKAEKASNNNGLSTVGIPIELVVATDSEVVMLDPKDPSSVIRQWGIDLYEKCVPESSIGCFAFSSRVPGKLKEQRIHLFTLPLAQHNDVIKAFRELEENKRKFELKGETEENGHLI